MLVISMQQYVELVYHVLTQQFQEKENFITYVYCLHVNALWCMRMYNKYCCSGAYAAAGSGGNGCGGGGGGGTAGCPPHYCFTIRLYSLQRNIVIICKYNLS